MVDLEGRTAGLMGSEQWIGELVQRVLYAIAQRQQNEKEYAIAVFTGGTIGLKEALIGIETLLVHGLSMRIVLSESARHLYGSVVDERLLPWPGVTLMEPEKWLIQIKKSTGIIVPMLSVNTLSKASALMADSLTGNIILQGLFMGKPLVAAIDGAVPGGAGRKALGLDSGSSGLHRAVAERFIQFSDLGGSLTWSSNLGVVGQGILMGETEIKKTEQNSPLFTSGDQHKQTLSHKAFDDVISHIQKPSRVSVVDAATVRKANREGVAVQAMAGALFTPLAKELAQKYGTRVDTK